MWWSSLENERPSGTFNRPAGMDAQVLAMVLREATGRSLSTYMEERLWSRLGMESDAFWIVDRDGMELAFGGLHAQLRDYARFGLVFSQRRQDVQGSADSAGPVDT